MLQERKHRALEKRNEELDTLCKLIITVVKQEAAFKHFIINQVVEQIDGILSQYPAICAGLQEKKAKIDRVHGLIKRSISLQVENALCDARYKIDSNFLPSSSAGGLSDLQIPVCTAVFKAIADSAIAQQFLITEEAANTFRALEDAQTAALPDASSIAKYILPDEGADQKAQEQAQQFVKSLLAPKRGALPFFSKKTITDKSKISTETPRPQ